MDFRPNPQVSGSRPTPVTPTPTTVGKKETKPSNSESIWSSGRWMQILSLVIVIGIAILLASVALAVGRGSNTNESQYISSSRYQAVFLSNGQVYFGKIVNLNSQYVRLANVYYLTQGNTSDSKSSDNNYSLVKLGCQQIHDPTDQMVINRSQVTFWENLESSGKVVTTIQQFQKQNPKGPDCTQVSNQTQASDTSAAAQGGSSANATSSTSNSSSSTGSTGTSTTPSSSSSTK